MGGEGREGKERGGRGGEGRGGEGGKGRGGEREREREREEDGGKVKRIDPKSCIPYQWRALPPQDLQTFLVKWTQQCHTCRSVEKRCLI